MITSPKNLATAVFILGAATSQAVLIEISVSAPTLSLAPSWGQFSSSANPVISGGVMASAGIESLAEDGGTGTLIGERGGQQLFGPTFAGNTNSTIINVGSGDNWFNFAAMLLPSNDFFIATGGVVSPLDISSLLDGSATSLTLEFTRFYDAGTEVEDFATIANPPPVQGITGITSGQTGPDQGADQNGLISLVGEGSNPFESFLNQPNSALVAGLDPRGQTLATITLSAVPEPSSTLLGGIGALLLGLRRRRK